MMRSLRGGSKGIQQTLFCQLRKIPLQVPVVDGAAAVRGLGRLLVGVEQATQLTVEACPRDNELHPQRDAVFADDLVLFS